jgi:hypothetical protein
MARAPLKGRGERVYRPHAMTEETTKLALALLCGIERKLDLVGAELQDLKVRLSAVGDGLAVLDRRFDGAILRLERIDARLAGIEGAI